MNSLLCYRSVRKRTTDAESTLQQNLHSHRDLAIWAENIWIEEFEKFKQQVEIGEGWREAIKHQDRLPNQVSHLGGAAESKGGWKTVRSPHTSPPSRPGPPEP